MAKKICFNLNYLYAVIFILICYGIFHFSFNQKITKHFQIKSSLSKEMHDSFLFIGDPSEISYLENIPNVRLLKESHPKFTSTPIKIYEVTF